MHPDNRGFHSTAPRQSDRVCLVIKFTCFMELAAIKSSVAAPNNKVVQPNVQVRLHMCSK